MKGKFCLRASTSLIAGAIAIVSSGTASAAGPSIDRTVLASSGGDAVADEQQGAPASSAAPTAAPRVDGETIADSTENPADIIVTAQRRSERLLDVPISMIAQSGAALEQAGITNMRDLTIAVPGLTLARQGAFVQPAIRGIQSTSGAIGNESPVATYVDGFYMPNQVSLAFDLPDVDNVEVLKGPQGTLFGRNATGGAINIHTKDPSFITKGDITVSDGAYFGKNVRTSNEFSVKGFLSTPIVDDVLAISASGFYDHVPGYMTNDLTGGRYGRIESYLLRGKILFKPASNLSFLLSGLLSKREDDANPTLFPLNGMTVSSFYNPHLIPTKPWHTAGEIAGGSHITSKFKSLNLTGTLDLDGIGTITSRTGYAYAINPLEQDVDAAYAPTCVTVVACVNFNLVNGPEKTFQQEISLTSKKFGSFSFTAGGLYYHSNIFQINNINPPLDADGRLTDTHGVVYLERRVITEAKALFGEIYYDLGDSLRLIGGLRYSEETKDGFAFGAPRPGFKDSAVTPRVSAVYKFTPGFNVYATYSQGFKSGVLNDANPPAQAEHIDAFEVGTKMASPVFSLNTSAFYYNYKNIQVQTFNGTVNSTNNAASARLYGLDVDGSIRFGGGFQLRGGATWLPKAEYRKYVNGVDFVPPFGARGLKQVIVDASGFRLLKAPKLTASITALYSVESDFGKFEASGTLYHSSALNWDLLGRIRTEAYETVSGQIALYPVGTSLKLSVWARNLLNKAYVASAVPSAQADAVGFGSPRQIGVSVGYKF